MPRGQRVVEQQHILDFALQHAALNTGADGHDFIRVHTAVGFFPEKSFTT